MKTNLIIAIDGYSSCGKSTLAKALAARLQLIYVDSGAMYRGITWYFLENKIPVPLADELDVLNYDYSEILQPVEIAFQINRASGRSEIVLNGQNIENQIRNLEVSKWVSHVSAIKEVREKLVTIQQGLGKKGGIVMDGRDIGTTVFPHADFKIFMTAEVGIRAKRRFQELKEKGVNASYNEILKNITERDYEDTNRKVSPLRKAKDAIELNNTHLDENEQLEFVLKKLEQKNLIETRHLTK